MHWQKKTSSTLGPAKTPLLFWNVTKNWAHSSTLISKKYLHTYIKQKNTKTLRMIMWLHKCLHVPFSDQRFCSKIFSHIFHSQRSAQCGHLADRQTGRWWALRWYLLLLIFFIIKLQCLYFFIISRCVAFFWRCVPWSIVFAPPTCGGLCLRHTAALWAQADQYEDDYNVHMLLSLLFWQ